MINVIIPIGGKNSRFEDLGVVDHKALLKLNSRENILNIIDYWRFSHGDVKFWFILRSRDKRLKETIESYLKFNGVSYSIMTLAYDTEGPVDTVSQVNIDNNDRVIICDCDILPNEKINTNLSYGYDSKVFYFIDNSNNERFSFINEENGSVIDIIEKKRISNKCIFGIYVFRNFEVLSAGIKSVIKNDGEKFMSQVISSMIPSVECVRIDEYFDIGTIDSYLNELSITDIFVDFDGVLANTEKEIFESYRSAIYAVYGVKVDKSIWDKYYLNDNYKTFVPKILDHYSISYSDFDISIVHDFKKKHFDQIVQYVNVNRSLIDWIKNNKKNFTFYIVSSSSRANISSILGDDISLFKRIYHGGLVRNNKPSPDIYKIASHLKNNRQCIAFEDSDTGVVAASLAGIDTIRFNYSLEASND